MNKETSCADSLAPKIGSTKKVVIICTLIIIAVQIAANYLVYHNLARVNAYYYYKDTEALEQIHNVQIKLGKVSPRIQNGSAEKI